jgi:hypothetical protein
MAWMDGDELKAKIYDRVYVSLAKGDSQKREASSGY